jgi:hypothetical protein
MYSLCTEISCASYIQIYFYNKKNHTHFNHYKLGWFQNPNFAIHGRRVEGESHVLEVLWSLLFFYLNLICF